jgi:hypothetical protein
VVGDGDALQGVLENLFEKLEPLLGELAFGHVPGEGDNELLAAHGLEIGRHLDREHPAFPGPLPGLVQGRAGPAQALPTTVPQGLVDVRVHLEHGHAQKLLARPAQDPAGGLVDVDEAPLAVDPIDGLGGLLHGKEEKPGKLIVSEPQLTFAPLSAFFHTVVPHRTSRRLPRNRRVIDVRRATLPVAEKCWPSLGPKLPKTGS